MTSVPGERHELARAGVSVTVTVIASLRIGLRRDPGGVPDYHRGGRSRE